MVQLVFLCVVDSVKLFNEYQSNRKAFVKSVNILLLVFYSIFRANGRLNAARQSGRNVFVVGVKVKTENQMQ